VLSTGFLARVISLTDFCDFKILVNLLSNAIKYAPAGSSVHVGVRQCTLGDVLVEAQDAGASDLKVFGVDTAEQNTDQIMTVISVRDQGRGIPADEMGNLFTEFVQLKVSQEMDRTSERTGSGVNHIGQTSGTGLGLSLVLKFVTKMNGHIWAANSERGGAVFSFCFPAANTGLAETRSPHSSMGELAQSVEVNTTALNVMLVDDSSKCSLKSCFVPLKADHTLTIGFHCPSPLCSDQPKGA